jgi:hypothetical protein
MIGLGGSIQNANCEVHSMQFMIAKNIEDTYEEMKRRWFGDSLHLDSYTEIKYIDGYQIDLNSESDLEAYMVVYGGYQKGVIDELHDYSIVLANSKQDAKKLGKRQLNQFPNMDHIDEIVNVFDNVESKFGFIEGEFAFKDNITIHTFVKLKK